MTDPIHLSRRQMLKAALGATVALAALDRAALALSDGTVSSSAGALSGGSLQPADRIVPSTTVPTITPPPAGRIAFPLDAQRDCWISDNFGACRGTDCSRAHEGLDIMGSRGANVYAVVTGRLTYKYVGTPGATTGAGNGWTLHDEANNTYYKYFHLATHTPGLVAGQMVTFGDVIGTIGNTGTSGVPTDTNYHLHFEYRPNNVAQDPRPLLVRPANCTFA